ncbi:Quercetin 2,3-dioxygenase [Andreprevotia sp. IGB-42]|uniref:pirin family protein n=1 Tax=Andreprevotia sp. IGB-42 TaxID=2497473 RepID=UPI001357EAB7|nr:pirin family protein [Andreprevotia sp. IGB-42]KAF0811850.1 Quercetin 2,3-dioxygenase [Andreprevotia sp. IGB-42]
MPATPQRIAAHMTTLGEGMPIRRSLPHRERRMIGAWCFLDHFGPVDIGSGAGMRVGPHPHIGLQTFSWLIEGEILHRDSLGYAQLIRSGQVNLMTAGHGISHSEESPADHSRRMHGAQLWIALPDEAFSCPPAFEHHPVLPIVHDGGFVITVLAGEFAGQTAPPRVYTPLIGLDLTSAGTAQLAVPLRADFEYGVIVLEGSASVNGEALAIGELLYFAPGARALALQCDAATRVLLIGGEPFASPRILYWNFVGRGGADIRSATEQWNAGDARFGEVHGYDGARLTAPEVPRLSGE